jgi:hypothetical protein
LSLQPVLLICAAPSTTKTTVIKTGACVFSTVDNRDRRNRLSSRKLSSTLRLSFSPYARPISTRPSSTISKRRVAHSTTDASVLVNVGVNSSSALFSLEGVSATPTVAPSGASVDYSVSYTASDGASDLVIVETVSSTSQENDPSLPVSTFTDLALVVGYYLPLNIVSHAISASTPLQVEPWQIHAIVCKFSLF